MLRDLRGQGDGQDGLCPYDSGESWAEGLPLVLGLEGFVFSAESVTGAVGRAQSLGGVKDGTFWGAGT